MSFNVLINQKCLLHKHTTLSEWITKPNHYSNFMVKYRPCIWWENVLLLLFFLSTNTNAAMVDCWANLAETFYDLGSWFGFGWWFNSHLIKWIGIRKKNIATLQNNVTFIVIVVISALSGRLFSLIRDSHDIFSVQREKKEVGHSLRLLVSMSRKTWFFFSTNKIGCQPGCFLEPAIK